MKPIAIALVAAALTATACSNSTDSNASPTTTEVSDMTDASTPTTTPTDARPTETAQAAVAALFIDFDVDAASELLTADYIQHNPGVPTGAEAVLQFIPALEESGLTITTHRTFTDGDLVVMHNTYDNADLFGGPTLVAFDVFRVEAGKVAEHWDNLQAPAPPNASGRTLTDGPTEVTDPDKTDINKALVAEFAETVLVGGAFDRIGEYIIGGDDYIQHNPFFGDGLPALAAGFAALAEEGSAIVYNEVHAVIGEGNFVLLMSEGTFGDTPTAYYDLLRVEDGLIVEHWDVIQEIPDEMAHDNGKF